MLQSQQTLSSSRLIINVQNTGITLFILFVLYGHYFISYGAPQIIFFCLLDFLLVFQLFKNQKAKIYVAAEKWLWLLFPCAIAITCNPNNDAWVGALLKYSLLIFFIILFGKTTRCFFNVLSIIEWTGLIFAGGVILEAIFPQLFQHFISAFVKSDDLKTILFNQTNAGIYAGFSTAVAITAGIATFAIISFTCRWKFATISQKKIIAFKIAILLIGMFLTGKRSQPLFLVITICAAFLLQNDKKNRMYKLVVLVFCGFIVLGILLLIEPFLGDLNAISRLLDTFIGWRKGADVTSGRNALYDYAWQLFQSSPIKGIGWGEYSVRYALEVNPYGVAGVHNVYLQILCESGIIGLVCFLLPIVVSYKKVLKVFLKKQVNAEYSILAGFAFCIQTFFLLYCSTDILLNIPLYYCMYFYAILIACNLYNTKPNDLSAGSSF